MGKRKWLFGRTSEQNDSSSSSHPEEESSVSISHGDASPSEFSAPTTPTLPLKSELVNDPSPLPQSTEILPDDTLEEPIEQVAPLIENAALVPSSLASSESLSPSSVQEPLLEIATQEEDTESDAVAADDEEALQSEGPILLGDRYTILHPLTIDQASIILGTTGIPKNIHSLYAVADTRSYECCWACGSTVNKDPQRFCVDCGASLQNHQLVLAQSAASTGEADEFVHEGMYCRILSPRKQFGITGCSLEIGGYSAEGPHHPNEDSYWSATLGGCYNSTGHMLGVSVLADGMGGYAPGSGLISKDIVQAVGSAIFANLLPEGPEIGVQETRLRDLVKSAIAAANNQVLTEIQQHGEMGATLVLVVVAGQTAYIANIGDSRAYYVAPSGTLTQITRDQSLVEQQVAAGLLDPAAAATAIGSNVILHAIGEEQVEESFDWYVQPLEPGCRILLCSDGYWKTLQHNLWDSSLTSQHSTLHDIAQSLVQNALAQGSDDNTTLVVLGIE